MKGWIVLVAILCVLPSVFSNEVDEDLATLTSFLEDQSEVKPMTEENVDEIVSRLKARWRDEDFADAQAMAQCRAQLAALQSLVDDNHDTLVTEKSQLLAYEAEEKLVESEIKNTKLEIKDKEKATEVVRTHMDALHQARERAHGSFLKRQASIAKTIAKVDSFIAREKEFNGQALLELSLAETLAAVREQDSAEAETMQQVVSLVQEEADKPSKKDGKEPEIVRLLKQLQGKLAAYKTKLEANEEKQVADYNSVVESFEANKPASEAALAALKNTLSQAERRETGVKTNKKHLEGSIEETEKEIHHLSEQYNELLGECRIKHKSHLDGSKKRAKELETVQKVQKIIFKRNNKFQPVSADVNALKYGIDLPELRAPPEKELGLPGCAFPYAPNPSKKTETAAKSEKPKTEKKVGKDDEESENRESHEFGIDHSRAEKKPSVSGDAHPPGVSPTAADKAKLEEHKAAAAKAEQKEKAKAQAQQKKKISKAQQKKQKAVKKATVAVKKAQAKLIKAEAKLATLQEQLKKAKADQSPAGQKKVEALKDQIEVQKASIELKQDDVKEAKKARKELSAGSADGEDINKGAENHIVDSSPEVATHEKPVVQAENQLKQAETKLDTLTEKLEKAKVEAKTDKAAAKKVEILEKKIAAQQKKVEKKKQQVKKAIEKKEQKQQKIVQKQQELKAAEEKLTKLHEKLEKAQKDKSPAGQKKAAALKKKIAAQTKKVEKKKQQVKKVTQPKKVSLIKKKKTELKKAEKRLAELHAKLEKARKDKSPAGKKKIAALKKKIAAQTKKVQKKKEQVKKAKALVKKSKPAPPPSIAIRAKLTKKQGKLKHSEKKLATLKAKLEKAQKDKSPEGQKKVEALKAKIAKQEKKVEQHKAEVKKVEEKKKKIDLKKAQSIINKQKNLPKNKKQKKQNKPKKSENGIAVFKHFVGANLLDGTNINGALSSLPWDENSRAASLAECQNRCAARAQCGAYVWHPGSYPAPWSFICILKQAPAPSVSFEKKWQDFGGVHVGVRQ